MHTQNTTLFNRLTTYTKVRIYESINKSLGYTFSSFEEFLVFPEKSHLLEHSSAFSTAISYIYTQAIEQVEIYKDPKSKRCDYTKAAFVLNYTAHVLFFAAMPNCPENWSYDQYIRMCQTMNQFFTKQFNTDLEV